MKRRVMILTAGVGSGHNIAAAAVAEICRRRPDCEALEQLDVLEVTNDLYRTLYDDVYFALVDAMPWLVSWGYERNNPPFRPNSMQTLWDQLNTTAVVTAVREFAPTTVICTHFLPARLVSLLIARGDLQATLSVITTDYDFQGLWLSTPFHRFFVARDETRAHMIEMGLPGDRITESGIPVRELYGQPIERAAVLARYQLRDDLPIVLISAGAAGGGYTEQVVRQALDIRAAFQAVVVCGRNDELRATLDGLVAAERERFRVLGYVTDMPDLMRVASVFVGKPGGLSSSECMAAGLPMVLVKPIPGQETRNSDFLLEGGAALRCNYETTVGYKLEWLLHEPQRLKQMAQAARHLGRPHAAADIVEQVLREPEPALWISREAQRLIRSAGEQGQSARRSDSPLRVVTLVDRQGGGSRAVVTPAQVEQWAELSDSHPSDGVTVTARRLRSWRRSGLDSDLLVLLRRILGSDEQCTLLLDPQPARWGHAAT